MKSTQDKINGLLGALSVIGHHPGAETELEKWMQSKAREAIETFTDVHNLKVEVK
jgi:hypothetical protein